MPEKMPKNLRKKPPNTARNLPKPPKTDTATAKKSAEKPAEKSAEKSAEKNRNNRLTVMVLVLLQIVGRPEGMFLRFKRVS